MTVFTCEHNWKAMLSCIYKAFESKLGHKNVRLCFEPIEQYTLFDEYIHVEPDSELAEKMMDLICFRISPEVYYTLAYCAAWHEKDVLNVIYRTVLLGFNFGPNVLEMVQYEDIMRLKEIRIALGSEVNHFIEFTRFHELPHGIYVAHIEPRSCVLQSLGHHFADRMPSEHWMIVDDTHKEAIVQPKDEEWYYRALNDDEFERLKHTEEYNDEFTDMWKVFFDTIAIKQRINPTCQRNLMPKWTRKHAVEFIY